MIKFHWIVKYLIKWLYRSICARVFLRIAVLKNSEISQENIGGRGGLQTLRKTSLTLISLRVWGPPLWVKGGGERNDLPLNILFCNFMVTYLNSWNLVSFPQICLGSILWIFFQNSNWFLQCQRFFAVSTHNKVLAFVHFLCFLSSVGIMNISSSPEGLEKKLVLTFVITHFQSIRLL